MSDSKAEPKATARRGLRSDSTSPVGSSTVTRSRSKQGQSPIRLSGNDSSNDDDEDVHNSPPRDEVDRCITKNSPNIYPDLSPFKNSDSSPSPGRSPKSDLRNRDSPNITHRTQCSPNSSPRGIKLETPLTPEKGSSGKKVHQLPREEIRRKRGIAPIMAIFFMCLLIFCILALQQATQNLDEIPSSKPYVKPIQDIYKDLKIHLKSVKSQFPQTRHFWIQLLGQLETIMIDYPRQPAVILAVVPEGAGETAVCLLHKIGNAVSDSFSDKRFVMFDSRSEMRFGSDHMKLKLFDTLSGLQNSHSAVVHDIEKINGKAAMTFHAFCDNENAPYKQVLIFLLLNVPSKYEDISFERLENTVDGILHQVWGEELPLKDVSAIISRMANAPVLISPHSHYSLKDTCSNV